MKNESYGAPVERGEIVEIKDNAYAVKSLTRDGVRTPPMRAISAETELHVGDRVYFFMFDDGKGMVIAKTE